MRPAIAVLLLAVSSACASSGAEEYEAGRMTPYARGILAQPSPAPFRAPADEPMVGMKEVEEGLEKLAVEWKDRARAAPADPARLGFAVGDAPGEERLRADLSPEIVYAAAFFMSPSIRSAREKLKATVQQFDQVAYLDAILRQYTGFTKDLNLRIGSARQKETVEQYFPFPGTMSLKTRIVAEDSKAAEQRLEQVVRSQLVVIGQTYYEYAYVKEAIQIVEENVELLSGIVEIAQSKYGVGATKQGVVLKAHVEIASLEDRLVTLREREATVRARMNSVLGLGPDFPLGSPGSHAASPPPEEPGPLYRLASAERQEIVALKARIRRTEALIELAETKAYPDLSLGYSRFEDGAATRVGGARMKEPFETDPRQKPRFWFGETASFIQEMRARLEAMRASLDELDARVGYEVKDAWFKWDAAYRKVSLYDGSILPQAEQAYEILESGWQEGIADFLDALDAQRTWLRFRLERRQAVWEANRSRLALLDALGTTIPADGGGK